MKNLKKWMTLMVFVLLVTSLVGCAPKATETPTEAVPPVVEAQPTATVAEPTAAPTEVPTVEPTAKPAEPVTIRYLAHNLGTKEENNAERQMMNLYMQLNPNVTIVEMDQGAVEGGWEANLTAYGAKGEFPDVYSAFNLPLYIQNDWLADLTALVAADAEWAKIPKALRDSVTYNSVVYGVPSAQFLVGYIVNKDLFEAGNLDAPEYGWTLEQFDAAIKGLNNPNGSVLGLDEIGPLLGWYPNAIDPKLKWFSFDGEKMNYNSAAFKEAMAKSVEYIPYSWNGLTEEQKPNFKATGPWELFQNSEVGMRFDYSWSFAWYKENVDFAWDFVGVPGGNQALVFDFIGVGKSTKNLEESYKFAKWMAFAPDAYAKRVEIAKTSNYLPNMPVAVDDASLQLYLSYYKDQPGIAKALANLDNSMIESVQKSVPGFTNARWEGKPGIVVAGEEVQRIDWFWDPLNFSKFKYEDYSAQLEEFANKMLADAKAQLNK